MIRTDVQNPRRSGPQGSREISGRSDAWLDGLPRPTTTFRHRAWLDFQRALDPLAPPKPLPLSRAR